MAVDTSSTFMQTHLDHVAVRRPTHGPKQARNVCLKKKNNHSDGNVKHALGWWKDQQSKKKIIRLALG